MIRTVILTISVPPSRDVHCWRAIEGWMVTIRADVPLTSVRTDTNPGSGSPGTPRCGGKLSDLLLLRLMRVSCEICSTHCTRSLPQDSSDGCQKLYIHCTRVGRSSNAECLTMGIPRRYERVAPFSALRTDFVRLSQNDITNKRQRIISNVAGIDRDDAKRNTQTSTSANEPTNTLAHLIELFVLYRYNKIVLKYVAPSGLRRVPVWPTCHFATLSGATIGR